MRPHGIPSSYLVFAETISAKTIANEGHDAPATGTDGSWRTGKFTELAMRSRPAGAAVPVAAAPAIGAPLLGAPTVVMPAMTPAGPLPGARVPVRPAP
jgi:hypothetical protein